MSFLNVGFGNFANMDKIIAIITPDSAPSKRMIQNYKEKNLLIDATSGRKTRGIIVLSDNRVLLSALSPEALAARIVNKKESSNE